MRTYRISAFADEAGGALDVQLAALKRNGISQIEMRMVDGRNASHMTAAEAVAVRARLDAAGVTLSSLGSPFGKIFADEDFEPHYQQFLQGLKLCRILGAQRMRVFSFYIPKGTAPGDWRGEVLRRLRRMLDAADEWGIRLLHENEKGIYGDTAARCADLLDAFGGRLGCIFDPANFIQCGEKPLENFALLRERVEYMHIKDALLLDGSVVPAGKGDGSVAEILADMPGDGCMTLSIEPHLTVFDGLQTLQTEILKQKYAYSDANEAFDAAAGALRGILAGLKREWR
ncbi:MAG: TIM barrel protein [Clostridia bacterium]|nr:TIM barrel protein [Clostridia bacterium]